LEFLVIKTALLSAALALGTFGTLCYAQVEPTHPHGHRNPETPVAATPTPQAETQAAKPAEAPALTPSDKLAVTHHELLLPGGPLHYTATAGYIILKDETGKPRANFFFTAYTKDKASTASTEPSASAAGPSTQKDTAPADPTRPITFVFNGGPGAASVWLHLGAVGPQRIALADDGTPLPPPSKVIDNPYTWLDTTDLVLIDPVGTGYSRAANPDAAKEFYNVGQDIESVGEFIRLYITKNERWGSPKFLAGESYGTTRASLLSDHLQDRVGITLNGVILISTVLSFQAISPSESNETPYALFFPTYTSAAFYHKKLPADLETDLNATLKQAQAFAMGPYLSALAQGTALQGKERADVIDGIARFTGLSRDYIDRANLKIDPSRFEKELLRDQHKIIGRFDSRVAAASIDGNGNDPEFDPSQSQYLGIYATAFNDYIRHDLRYENDLPYNVLAGLPWSFNDSGHGYLYVGDNLRSAMVKNPHLKLLVAAGYYDLATPFQSVNYTLDHLQLPPNIRANVTQTYYPGGHMLYHVKANLEKLHSDVKAFIEGAAPGK
jgi:carboxypeptidase C (cathepsin A)